MLFPMPAAVGHGLGGKGDLAHLLAECSPQVPLSFLSLSVCFEITLQELQWAGVGATMSEIAACLPLADGSLGNLWS